jgi:hypothetical protein
VSAEENVGPSIEVMIEEAQRAINAGGPKHYAETVLLPYLTNASEQMFEIVMTMLHMQDDPTQEPLRSMLASAGAMALALREAVYLTDERHAYMVHYESMVVALRAVDAIGTDTPGGGGP